jgi:hypothetical protein
VIKYKYMNKRGGFIQILIIVALLMIILSLLGVSLTSLFSDTLIKENFYFVGAWISTIWQKTVTFLKVQFSSDSAATSTP